MVLLLISVVLLHYYPEKIQYLIAGQILFMMKAFSIYFTFENKYVFDDHFLVLVSIVNLFTVLFPNMWKEFAFAKGVGNMIIAWEVYTKCEDLPVQLFMSQMYSFIYYLSM